MKPTTKKNPHAVAMGRLGGLAKVPKGTALMETERQREIDALRQQLDRTHAALESTQALAIDRYAAIQAHDAQMQQLRAGHDAATEALRARIIDPQMLQQLRSTLDDAQAALHHDPLGAGEACPFFWFFTQLRGRPRGS